MKLMRVFLTTCVALGLLVLAMGTLPGLGRADNEIELVKRLNKSTSVVKVGEVLSFTINLTNKSAFSLTHVTLLDNYENSVLAFAGADTAPDNTTSGEITWDNVADPPILPDQTLTFTLYFTAEHPRTSVVNHVQAKDIVSYGSAISNTSNQAQLDKAVGGAAPIYKAILPPGYVPQAGQPVTFTHLITNDGAAMLIFLPLTDTYNADFLEFNYAIPAPSLTSPGQLVWNDLTTDFGGPLPPGATVVVTTVFTSTQGGTTKNHASTAGARDEYNNDVTAGAAQVPITIIGEATPTSKDHDHDNNDTTVAATATPAAVATISAAVITGSAVVTEQNAPKYLPETGDNNPPLARQVGLPALILFAVGLSLLAGSRRAQS